MSPSSHSRVRLVVVTAIFTVLSFLGGLVKFGTPVGSVALDSWPSFFVAGHYSPLIGGVVGALGHLASAASAGFMLGWIHALVAVMQALWAISFGLILRRLNSMLGLVLAAVVSTLLNGVAAPWLLTLVDPAQAPLYRTLIPFLLVAAAINVLVAATMLAYLRFSKAPKL